VGLSSTGTITQSVTGAIAASAWRSFRWSGYRSGLSSVRQIKRRRSGGDVGGPVTNVGELFRSNAARLTIRTVDVRIVRLRLLNLPTDIDNLSGW
jgi:hypothetical protein